MTANTGETTINASASLPTITIIREFDAPSQRVFNAFIDPDLYAKWIGPHSVSTTIFDDLGQGRTRVTGVTLAGSFETRDGIIASGMSSGVEEGYQKLDALLATDPPGASGTTS